MLQVLQYVVRLPEGHKPSLQWMEEAKSAPLEELQHKLERLLDAERGNFATEPAKRGRSNGERGSSGLSAAGAAWPSPSAHLPSGRALALGLAVAASAAQAQPSDDADLSLEMLVPLAPFLPFGGAIAGLVALLEWVKPWFAYRWLSTSNIVSSPRRRR